MTTDTRKTIFFPYPKLDKIDAYCKKTGRSRSGFLVRAAEEYIARNPVK